MATNTLLNAEGVRLKAVGVRSFGGSTSLAQAVRQVTVAKGQLDRLFVSNHISAHKIGMHA